MTKPVWSYLMFWPQVPSQTIPDCIRYIIGVLAITLNHFLQNHSSVTMFINYVYESKKNIFANTLACSKT